METDLVAALRAHAGKVVKVNTELDSLFAPVASSFQFQPAAPHRTSTRRFSPTRIPASEFEPHGKTTAPGSDSESDSQTGSDSEGESESGDESEEPSAGLISTLRDEPPSEEEDVASGEDDAEKLDRTVFVGNLPMSATKKEVVKAFKPFGKVESVRFRSIARGETKMPRRAAAIAGVFDSGRQSKNAYIVFADRSDARTSLKLNGSLIGGHHIRVDVATARGEQRHYDNKKSVFVGQLPFDIEDETLYSFFGACGPVEAVRVVRDSKTNRGKGIAFIQFHDRVGAENALKLQGAEVGGRAVRISRIQASAAPAAPQARPERRRASSFQGVEATPGVLPKLARRRKAKSEFEKAAEQNKAKRDRSAKRKVQPQGEKRQRKMNRSAAAAAE